MSKTIHLHYYAVLKEARGAVKETVQTPARTALDLYEELKGKHGFKLSADIVKVAINDEFKSWDTPLQSGDTVVFIPPVAGG